MAVSLSVVVGRCIERIIKIVLSYRFGGGSVSVCDFGRGSGIDCCVTSNSKTPSRWAPKWCTDRVLIVEVDAQCLRRDNLLVASTWGFWSESKHEREPKLSETSPRRSEGVPRCAEVFRGWLGRYTKCRVFDDDCDRRCRSVGRYIVRFGKQASWRCYVIVLVYLVEKGKEREAKKLVDYIEVKGQTGKVNWSGRKLNWVAKYFTEVFIGILENLI